MADEEVDTTEKVTISTTFSAEHARLILDLEEEYQVNKPTALRLLLSRYIDGQLISLAGATRERIEMMLNNPAITQQFGFQSVEGFVDFAINRALQSLDGLLTDLRDPAVQSQLDAEEAEIALLLLQSSKKQPDGFSIADIAKETNMRKNMVRRILREFENRGWITETASGKYLPIVRKKLMDGFD